MCKVSIIIPTYNRADMVCNAIDCALGQTYRNKEVIVVDDGSTDNTSSMLSSYVGLVTVHHQDNFGPSVARNKGVELSSGDYVAFLDSDDLWHEEKISKQMLIMQECSNQVPCCICNARILDFSKGSNKIIGTSFSSADVLTDVGDGVWMNPAALVATRFLLFNQVALIRREAFQKSGGYNPSLRLLEDYELSFRIALLGPWAFINETLVDKFNCMDGIGVNAMGDMRIHASAWCKSLMIMMELRNENGDELVWRLLDKALSDATKELQLSQKLHGHDNVKRFAARFFLSAMRVKRRVMKMTARWPKPDYICRDDEFYPRK